MSFVQREPCGCIVAAVVEDDDFHYVEELARWKRKGLTVERLPIEQARGEAIARSTGTVPPHAGGWCEMKTRKRSRSRGTSVQPSLL